MGVTSSHSYITDLAQEVKKKLKEYMQTKGRAINRNGSFQCIFTENHKNEDRNFSASLSQKSDGTYVWNCHTCNRGGTIYDMAYHLEGLGISGPEFTNTTLELAERFGIPVDREKLPVGNQEQYDKEQRILAIMREIEAYIHANGDAVIHLTNGRFGRQYTPEAAMQIREWIPIGVVDTQALTDHIRSRFPDDIKDLPFYNGTTGILDPMVFSQDRLTLSIRNHQGRPVGFTGRMEQEKFKAAKEAGESPAKYKFTSGMRKKNLLFMFDVARDAIRREKRINIVEGPFDCISMHVAGYPNTVAMQGSSISADLIGTISIEGILDYVQIPDGDKAGVESVKRAAEVLKSYPDIVSYVAPIAKGSDPDSAVMDGSIKDAMKNLVDPIMYVLTRDENFQWHGQSAMTLYTKITQWIAGLNPRRPRIREAATHLSEMFSYPIEDIIVDIENLDGKLMRSAKERQIWDDMAKAANQPLAEKILKVESSLESMKTLVRTEDGNIMDFTWQSFLGLVNQTEKLPDVLRTGFTSLDSSSDIECGSLTFWSGWPSNGKSSLIRFLIHQFLKTNDDLFAFYVCTDDDPRKAHLHMTSIITEVAKRELEESIRDGTFRQRPEVEGAWDKLQSTFKERLCIMGYTDCYSLAQVRKHVEQLRAQHSGSKPFLLIVDAINDLSDLNTDSQREATETVIREFKRMAVRYDAAVSLVSHLTKQDAKEGTRPTMKKLKGSSFLEFAAKTIFLMHMSAHYNKHTKLRWSCGADQYPIIEVNIAKDKDNKANEIAPLKFNPMTGHFSEPSSTDIKKYLEYIRAENEALHRRGGGGDDGILS